jgi:hypothetical protein
MEKLGRPGHPVVPPLAYKENVTLKTSIPVQAKKIESSRFYLEGTGIRTFGLNGRGLSPAGIFACVNAAVRCASNP